jgi:exopolyphosphatase/guanosine-5'-triphosphate,3'-diphosphate pyrophosphatase
LLREEIDRSSVKNRVAVLDVGSNSVRLLVADQFGDQFFPVYTGRIVSRLFEGLKDGALDIRSMGRTLDAIRALGNEARAQGADKIYGFGTSAMRDGHQNSALLIDRARQLGVALRVLPGEEEALLAYAGAAPGGSAGVIDIGGGSTEFMTGEDGRVLAAASAQMGAVRLKELAQGGTGDPAALLALAREALESSARKALSYPPRDGWVGVGGTFTALASMELGLTCYDGARVQDFRLAASAAFAWLTRLCGMSLSERLNIPGLIPERADIIPFGAAIAAACFDLIDRPFITISDRDNLLGFLRLALERG